MSENAKWNGITRRLDAIILLMLDCEGPTP